MDSGFHVSNGIGWSPDDRVMYFADSAHGKIYAYDFDLDSGEVANRRAFVSMPEGNGLPDGLSVDSEGGVWVACWDGWSVTRYGPDGVVDRIVPLPVPRPTSCTFGGPDLTTLFVTTARIRLSSQVLADAPLSGSVLAVDAGVRGQSETVFGQK
jgi:sugar lactone lactonase YvrE